MTSRWCPIAVDGPVDADLVASLADRALESVASALDISLEGWAGASLSVGAHPSSVVGREVRIEAKPARGAMTVEDWLELLLRHELTHLLLAERWGTAPVLMWEGLPIHLGDAHVRGRVLGISYAAHCRALLDNDLLLPLGSLLLPSSYYALRTDLRVDVQAGAFCGWLLDEGLRDRLRELFAVWERPRPDRPEVRLAWVAEALGASLAELEAAWHDALRLAPVEPELVARYTDFTPRPPRPPHCDFCMHPRPAAGPCPGCGAEPVPVRVIG